MALEPRDIKKAIEAIVFTSDKPVSVERLSQVFSDLTREEVEQCLRELIDEWNGMDRGFRLYEVAGGYQFRTSPQLSDFIIRFKQLKPFRLSRAALEVLAIVAYKQPITRIEIDEIRGVDSSGVIALLLERRLIRIKGRKDVVGRPFLYSTTDEFLETFGLRGLGDLPTLKELGEIERSLGRLPGESD